jgi:hypothetical protein
LAQASEASTLPNVADCGFVVLTVALFALFALIARAVDKL